MYKTASRIAKHISLHGPSADALNDMLLIADNEDMTPLQRREICTYVRQQARKLMSDEGIDIIFRAYCISGRDSFDDYMSACEFYRAPNARFWWPRRKILEGKHHIATQIQEFIDDPNAIYLGFSMPPGSGKLLADYTPVLTRKGWKTHGELVVGDEVVGRNGEWVKVLNVFPKYYANRRVWFTNGEHIDCHEDHEWVLRRAGHKEEGVYETKQLERIPMEHGPANGRGHRYNNQMPICEALHGDEKVLPVHPYVLGAWLGDGTNQVPCITVDPADKAIAERIDSLGYTIRHVYVHPDYGTHRYVFNDLRPKLRELGMCESHRYSPKRIPDMYLTASYSQRLELLAGILDTDGTKADGTKYRISTVSPALKDDIVHLIASFGWRCTVINTPAQLSSSGIQGRQSVWAIQFCPHDYVPCVIPRKQITEFGKVYRVSISNITPIDPVRGNCIEVEGGVYRVGNTMLLTHNSTLIKFLMAYIMGRYPNSANMYCSYSSGMTKLMLDSERAILTDTDEYKHNSVFPDNGFPEISSEYSFLTFRGKGDAPTLSLVSIGGSVTGRTRANKFLVTDDLVKDAEEARSPERLANLYNDYKSTLTTREIGDKVKEIQLGTRWSVHDPIGRMQAEHDGDDRYRFIAIPVMDENGESNFEYEHPDNYTKEKIMQIKASLDPVDFSCLYMQKGIEKEGLALPAESLQYYNGVLPPGEPDRKLFFVDVAFGGGDSLSMPICYKYGDTGYVVDVVFDKSAKDITMPRVIGKIKQHGLQMGRFEANNGGDFFAEDVDKQLRADGYHCNITSKRASGHSGKLARIEQYVPDIKRLYFLEAKYRDNEYRKFMDEATTLSFTAKNLHDDAADSLAGLCEYGFEKPKMVQAYKRLF